MAKPSIKQYVFKAAAAKRIPVSGTFELTARCNLSCRMCYVHMSPQQVCGRELSTQQWLAIGRQAVDAGMVYLLLTGGEPLLRPDFLEIYREMVKMGVVVSINTNGTLITPEIVECFREYPPEAVNVTLYGASSRTYQELCGLAAGYEKAKQGVLMLKQAGIRVNINTTFTACNESDMEELVAFAKSHQLPIRTAAYVFPKVRNGRAEQTVALSPEAHGQMAARFDCLVLSDNQRRVRRKKILACLAPPEDADKMPQSRPAGCLAGKGAFWITWEGNMLSCGMLDTFSESILQKNFADCWDQICAGMQQVYLPAECSVCRYDPVCPVCAALTQSLNGESTAVPKEMCRYIRAYCGAFLSLTESLEISEEQIHEEPGQQDAMCIL